MTLAALRSETSAATDRLLSVNTTVSCSDASAKLKSGRNLWGYASSSYAHLLTGDEEPICRLDSDRQAVYHVCFLCIHFIEYPHCTNTESPGGQRIGAEKLSVLRFPQWLMPQ